MADALSADTFAPIFTSSPMQKVCVDGFELYVKRDDLLLPQFPELLDNFLTGNKARKFQSLLEQDCSEYERIVSYGSAQGNGLVALAAIAKIKGLAFDYYVDHISDFLVRNPAGNYKAALSLGVNFHQVKLKQNAIDKTLEQYVTGRLSNLTNSHYVPEGGANEQAKVGVYQLADELMAFFESRSESQMKVMLPSGTGTMAWFLQQRFAQKRYPIEVWTCACVGSNEYLLEQFKRFASYSRLTDPVAPLLLEPNKVLEPDRELEPSKKYHFGKLYREFWHVWQSVGEQTGVEFELLYDPLGWICLLDKLKSLSAQPLVVYIHQGGVLGNQTMLSRYRRKFT